MQPLIRICLITLTISAISACAYNQRPLYHASPEIRVLISQGKELSIQPQKNYVLTVNGKKEMAEGPIYLSVSNDSILFNDMEIQAVSLEISPSQSFDFKKKRYRGSILIQRSGDGLVMINVTDIESYLYGVLPNEVSANWDFQALKAQAVVSRTYALFEVVNSRRLNRPFDLYDDTRSQVYDGMGCETRNTSMAIDSTMGEVLRYQGRIIQSFFHASSGGMTESSKEAFGYDHPYLVPVESGFSAFYRDNKWEIQVPFHKMENALRLQSKIKELRVIDRTDSKRIKTIQIADDKGTVTNVNGKDLRNIIGAGIMKSTRANIRLTNDAIVISGIGYGHGVGMGQWDAQGMAKQGYTYRDIARYFYPGTTLDKIW